MTDLNIKPYFDDFQEDKQFYQILFRPGYPIQARELTQLQTIIQKQVSRFGSHVFKEGSLVIPGSLGIDKNVGYVKLAANFGTVAVSTYVKDMVGFEIVGSVSGVRASIVDATQFNDTDPNTLFVKYTSAGSDGTTKQFLPDETISTDSLTPAFVQVASGTTSVGSSSRANIQRGVYFVNGKFVLVEEQSIMLDKYTNSSSYKVGLSVLEKVISPEEDSSLFDNAIGSTNQTAPGAHRLFIDLKLVKFAYDEITDSNFIELTRIKESEIEQKVDKSSYAILADSLARRTYDESGNYTVKDFGIQVREYRSNDRGQWSANTRYEIGDVFYWGNVKYNVDVGGLSGIVAPSATIGSAFNGSLSINVTESPVYNNGAFLEGSKDSVSADIDPGKAYVLGYEIEKNGLTHVELPKANTFSTVRSGVTQTHLGSIVKINNVFGALDITQYPTVNLYDRFTVTPGTSAGTLIGTAKARYVEYDSGTIGSAACQYLLSLFDVTLNAGKKFESDVRQIQFTNGSGTNFTCDSAKISKIISGSVTTASASPSVTGIGTKFTKDLTVGDTLGFASSFGIVSSIASDTALTLTTNAGSTNTSVAGYRIYGQLIESTNTSLISDMPVKNIRKIRDADDESQTNISYYVKSAFTGVASAGDVIISTSGADTFLSPDQPDNYHVVSATDGSVIASTISLNPTLNIATITVGGSFDTDTISVIATIRRTLKEKKKSIVRAFSEDFTALATAKLSTITLGKVDGIKLIKVYEYVDGGGTPVAFGAAIPGGSIPVDITDRYSLDGGQTDSKYGFASLVNQTAIAPRSPIRVFYDYFEHSSTGDYFSCDSYPKITNVEYTSLKQGKTFDLLDSLDFRPTQTSVGFGPSLIPAIGFPVEFDYSFFLPRIDKIALTSEGNIIRVAGTPSLTPADPKEPDNSMPLYSVRIEPNQVAAMPMYSLVKFDNKRYTMKDIGNIDSRLKNVEYYTSLSLLEEQTKNLQMFNANGDVAFKNGFIVDALDNSGVSDTGSEEFRASIDPNDKILRPQFSIENLGLLENVETSAQRKSAGYQNNNGVITLDFTEQRIISQPYATHDEAVVPFIKVSFNGLLNLFPSSDDFFEIKYLTDSVRFVTVAATTTQVPTNGRGIFWRNWNWAWSGVTTTNAGQIISSEIVNDRIVSTDVAHFIQGKSISFKASGMKPRATIYSFFDTTNVASYITPAVKIDISGKVGEFDSSTDAGINSDQTARTYQARNDSATTSLSKGDVIHNGAGGVLANATATAVCLLDEEFAVRVTNVRGTFVNGQTIYGTISGATGTITAMSTPTSLVSNDQGEVVGMFSIPSTSAIKFKTGERKFILTDSITNGINWTTKGEATYTSKGVIVTRQKDVVTTRAALPPPVQVDPIAQSFKTPVGDGYFVSSVDIYFSVKDKTLPVMFEIREMQNGVPTGNILPGSRVTILPKKITTSTNSSVATNIKMEYPVFLHGNTEYCFVLLSDSVYYRVWVSQLGENDVLTGERIGVQPYLGTMFKSQNASTWNAEQLMDIKFGINFCNFVSTANIPFVNSKVNDVVLDKNAFFTKSGSSKVRVNLPNHGFIQGMNATISGVLFAINGIPTVNLNGTHSISSVEQDSFVFDAGANATVSGYSKSTETMYSSRNIKFDLIHTSATSLEFPGTALSFFAKPINSQYAREQYPIELDDNVNVDMAYPCYILSTENETVHNSNNKSLVLTTQLQTTNKWVTPVLDTDRFSLNLIGNRIDVNAVGKNITGLDDLAITFTGTFAGSTLTASAANPLLSTIVPGQLVVISGATNGANNTTFSVTEATSNYIKVDGSFTGEVGSSITVNSLGRYVSEVGNGSSEGKYLIKELNLLTPASYLKVFFDVNMKSPSTLTTYYRTGKNGESISNKNWTKVSPVNNISYVNDASFFGAEYTITPGYQFDSAQIKIVFESSDSSKVPVIKNGIRLIAAT